MGKSIYSLKSWSCYKLSELLFCAEFALKQTRVLKHNLVIFDSEQHQVCHPNSLTIRARFILGSTNYSSYKKDRFEIFAQSISNQNDKKKKYEILVRMKDTKGDSISLFFYR